MLAQQQVHQFTEVGQEQCTHAGMKAAGLLAANGQQAVLAVMAQRDQGNRLDRLCLVTKQVLQLLGLETPALGSRAFRKVSKCCSSLASGS